MGAGGSAIKSELAKATNDELAKAAAELSEEDSKKLQEALEAANKLAEDKPAAEAKPADDKPAEEKPAAEAKPADYKHEEHDKFFEVCGKFDALIIRCNPGQINDDGG